MSDRFTFTKKERLRYKKHIDCLFTEGKSFTINPLKVFYQVMDTAEVVPAKVLMAIPSKRIRRAVDRNRLRRLIREAYRLNRHRIAKHPKHLHIAFVYLGKPLGIQFPEIEAAMIDCLEILKKI